MVSTVMSTDFPSIVSTTDTFETRIPTNDTAARGRNSVRDFYCCILCVSSAYAKADSLPPRKCIIFYRWQTVVRMTMATSWRFVRVAIPGLQLVAQIVQRAYDGDKTLRLYFTISAKARMDLITSFQETLEAY